MISIYKLHVQCFHIKGNFTRQKVHMVICYFTVLWVSIAWVWYTKCLSVCSIHVLWPLTRCSLVSVFCKRTSIKISNRWQVSPILPLKSPISPKWLKTDIVQINGKRPNQWEMANFDPPQLRNRLTNLDEIQILELSPEDQPPSRTSLWSNDVGGLSEYPAWLERQFSGFVFPQVVH